MLIYYRQINKYQSSMITSHECYPFTRRSAESGSVTISSICETHAIRLAVDALRATCSFTSEQEDATLIIYRGIFMNRELTVHAETAIGTGNAAT